MYDDDEDDDALESGEREQSHEDDRDDVEPQSDDAPEADDDEDSAEQRRLAHREKRRLDKERRRAARERDRTIIEEQSRRIAALEERLNGVAQRADLGQIDAALQHAAAETVQAQRRLLQAKEAGDAAGEIAAQEDWLRARGQADQLRALKEQATRTPPRPELTPTQIAAKARVDAYRDKFVEENSWFDPSGTDADSRAAIQISNQVAADGYPAHTPAHWAEIDRRLKAQMPHLYGAKKSTAARSPVGGGGQRSTRLSADDTRRIPRDAIEAFKEAGLWDTPEQRKEMTKKYFESSRKFGI